MSALNPKTVATTERLFLYVVRTDPRADRHHGFRVNHSPYLLALRVRPGDQVVAVLPVGATREVNENGAWRRTFCEVGLPATDVESQCDAEVGRQLGVGELELVSHASSSASLGEDDREGDAEDALARLIPEAIENECAWNYAPIDLRLAAHERMSRRWTRNDAGAWQEVAS